MLASGSKTNRADGSGAAGVVGSLLGSKLVQKELG